MDSEKCKVVIKAIELGSLSAAADALGYTPSGISRVMNAMESEAGFPLLIRRRSGVVPTKECIELLPMMNNIVAQAEKYNQTAADFRGYKIGTIAVGTAYTTFYTWMGKTIEAFRKLFPLVQIEFVTGNSTTLANAMDEHKLDFGLISYREGNFKWQPMFSDQMVAWVPPESPYAKMDRIPMEVFAIEPYISTLQTKQSNHTRVLGNTGITPNVQYITPNSLATYAMVEAGLGLSINHNLLSGTLRGNVVTVPLDPPQTVEIGIIAPYDDELSPAAKQFLKFANEHIGELQLSTNKGI